MNKKSLITLFFLSFYTITHYCDAMSMRHSDGTPLSYQEQMAVMNGCMFLTKEMQSGSPEEVRSKKCFATGILSAPFACVGGMVALTFSPSVPGCALIAVTGAVAIIGCGSSYCISPKTCTNALCCGHQCCASQEEQRSLVRSQPGMR